MNESIWSLSGSPPDDSGSWFDDGWGNWVKTPTTSGSIPDGFIDDGWGNAKVLAPVFPSATLDKNTVNAVENAKKEAKSLGDTKVGKFLNGVLTYGNDFLKLAMGFKILIDPSSPVSYKNIDKTKLEEVANTGELDRSFFSKTPNTDPPKLNSTYFGIDFSNPLTWVVVAFAIWGLYKLFNQVPVAVQPVFQQAKRR